MKIARVFQASQDITVSVNDHIVFSGTITPETSDVEFKVPRDNNGLYFMRIDIPNAISPRELNLSRDGRKLGLMLQSITVGQR
jgi:hypothetical protein